MTDDNSCTSSEGQGAVTINSLQVFQLTVQVPVLAVMRQ